MRDKSAKGAQLTRGALKKNSSMALIPPSEDEGDSPRKAPSEASFTSSAPSRKSFRTPKSVAGTPKAGGKKKGKKKRKEVVMEEAVQEEEETKEDSGEEDNYKDVLPGHPVFDVVCVSTRSNRFDAQMAAGLPEQMHAAVGKGIPRRSTQLELEASQLAADGIPLTWAPQLSVVKYSITRLFRKEGVVGNIWAVTPLPKILSLDPTEAMYLKLDAQIIPKRLQSDDSWNEVLMAHPFSAAQRCQAVTAHLNRLMYNLFWDQRGQGAHGVWELSCYQPNRQAILQDPATLAALNNVLIPPEGEGILRDHTLFATECAAGAVWMLARDSDRARVTLLENGVLEALILLLQKLLAIRLSSEESQWEEKSLRAQIGVAAFCTMLSDVDGIRRLLKPELDKYATKKPGQARAIGQKKREVQHEPRLQDIDQASGWRVLFAACEPQSSPDMLRYTLPAEEIGINTLRHVLLNPFMERSVLIKSFLSAGGLFKIIDMMTIQRGYVQLVACYIVSQIVIVGDCWAGPRGYAPASELFQVLVEMLHKAQTVSVEEYALQIQPTKVTKMELREPEVVAEPAGAGAEEGENTNHAASEASDGLGRDQAETAASLSGTTNEKAEAEERARLEKIQEETKVQKMQEVVARSWARMSNSLWSCARVVAKHPEPKVADSFKELLQVARSAALAQLDTPISAVGPGLAGAVAGLATSRAHSQSIINLGGALTIAKMLKASETTVRVQAAAAVVLLGWHCPPPRSEALKGLSPDDRAEMTKTLAPPMFNFNIKVPLEGLHRDKLVRAGCPQALLLAMHERVPIANAMQHAALIHGERVRRTEVEERHAEQSRQLVEAGSAALMVLGATNSVHEAETLKRSVGLLDAAQASCYATQYMAAAVWCLARNRDNWTHLVKANAVAKLVENAWRTVTDVLDTVAAAQAKIRLAREEAERERLRQQEEDEKPKRPVYRVNLDLPWETPTRPESPAPSHVSGATERASGGTGSRPSSAKSRCDVLEDDASEAESDGAESAMSEPFAARPKQEAVNLHLHSLEFQLAAIWILICNEGAPDAHQTSGAGRNDNSAEPGSAGPSRRPTTAHSSNPFPIKGWEKLRAALRRQKEASAVKPEKVSSLSPRGVDLVMTLLREHSNAATAELLFTSKVFELCTSQLCTLVLGPALSYVGHYLVDTGALDVLWALVHNQQAPLLARARGAQVYHVLACTEEGMKVTKIAQVSDLLVYLMHKDMPLDLQMVGVRGAAILAIEHKVELAKQDGIKHLIDHMNNPSTEEIKLTALKALLNLSLNSNNQVRICKRALPALLRLNIDPKSSTDVLTFTSGILHNLSKNPTNTTAFYKAELHMRLGRDPTELAPADKSDVPEVGASEETRAWRRAQPRRSSGREKTKDLGTFASGKRRGLTPPPALDRPKAAGFTGRAVPGICSTGLERPGSALGGGGMGAPTLDAPSGIGSRPPSAFRSRPQSAMRDPSRPSTAARRATPGLEDIDDSDSKSVRFSDSRPVSAAQGRVQASGLQHSSFPDIRPEDAMVESDESPSASRTASPAKPSGKGVGDSPPEPRREPRTKLHKSLCQPKGTMWAPISADTYGMELSTNAYSLDHPDNITRWQPRVHGYKRADWEREMQLRSATESMCVVRYDREGGATSGGDSSDESPARDRPPPLAPAPGSISKELDVNNWWEANQKTPSYSGIPPRTSLAAAGAGVLQDDGLPSKTWRPVTSGRRGAADENNNSNSNAAGVGRSGNAGGVRSRLKSALEHSGGGVPGKVTRSLSRPASSRPDALRPTTAPSSRPKSGPRKNQPANALRRSDAARPSTARHAWSGHALPQEKLKPWALAAPHRNPQNDAPNKPEVATIENTRFQGCSVYPHMTLYLEPNSTHHAVSFHGRADRWRILPTGEWDNPRDKMWMFQSIRGAKFSEGLYPTYRLPDGREMHYYHKGRRLVDEVPAYWERLKTPVNIEDIFQEALPFLDGLVDILQHAQIDLLTEDADMEGAEHELIFPGQPPRPRRHTLDDVQKHVCSTSDIRHCTSHGVLNPTPLIIVTQLSGLPPPPPIELPPTPSGVEDMPKQTSSPSRRRLATPSKKKVEKGNQSYSRL